MNEVIIVGAGPVGLTAALRLAQAGMQVLVLEREPAPNTEWRASTFHAPTLEMCEEIGVIDMMLEQGIVATKFQVRDWSQGRVAEFDFSALADETKYPYRLQLEQYKYSAILRDRLASYPKAKVRFGTAVAEVQRTSPDVQVKLENGEVLQTQWLIAADGANSAVRRSLKLSFEGLTYASRALLLSISAPLDQWFPDICYVNYVADTETSPGMILRIPDVWRVSFQIPDEMSDEEAVSDAYVEGRLHGIFGDRDIPVSSERRVFRVHQRVAGSFKVGHVLLMGDAAHINSPLGGMGLNSGIHDGYHLGTVLPKVIAQQLPESALEEWAEARRKVALGDIQRITHRNATELQDRDPERVNATLQRYMDIARDPVKAKAWMREAAMLTSVRAQGIQARARQA